MRRLRFKIADQPAELEQLPSLMYRTFVEEIPQHPPNEARRHVDRFHSENTYAVCLDGETVIGMLALRKQRPFSLDGKLANLDDYLPQGRRVCEIRLLAIEKAFRSGPVLPGLLSVLWEDATADGFDAAVISATTRQLRLYDHIGFVPFGPLVGSAEAPFQPMVITRERFDRRMRPGTAGGRTVNFLPGPVEIHPDVAAAFRNPPSSHRGDGFADELRAVETSLLALTNARNVEVLLGTGTLANDAVAAQLAGAGGRGAVMANGEFGERLIDHASRAGLAFDAYRFAWGERLNVDEALGTHPAWLWMTACETSTGVLNDVATVAVLCRALGVRLCLDAVSAVGGVPADLSDVWFATAVSGKALGSYPGLSMVFHSDPIAATPTLPRYLDLGLYAESAGVPFTHSSNLMQALRAALVRVDWPQRYEQTAELGRWLRRRLAARGFAIVGESALPAPHVITLALPPPLPSGRLGRALEDDGFLLAWRSRYLRERNWIQLCLMGEATRQSIAPLLRTLAHATG